MEIAIRLICLFAAPIVAAAQSAGLEGYLFREADGGSPRRPLTLELIDQGRTRYRVRTRPDGSFAFNKLREGRYRIRARLNDFVIVDDVVTVVSSVKNFAAMMLPKRRAEVQVFGTVTARRLATESDARLQQTLRQGSRLVARRDFSGAARTYEQAVTARPQPEIEDALGLLYLYMGDKPKAQRSFEKAIGEDPKYLLPYDHLAASYLEQRRYRELAAVSSRALTIDPRWMSGHAYLAEARAGEGNLRAAQQAAETASEISKGRAPGPYLLLSKINWAMRDCARARRFLERYLELNTSARELPEISKWRGMMKGCPAAP